MTHVHIRITKLKHALYVAEHARLRGYEAMIYSQGYGVYGVMLYRLDD